MTRPVPITAGLMLLALTAGPAGATDHQESLNSPDWADRRPVCKVIDLVSDASPSGESGEAGGGYNAYSLSVVARRGVTCARARRLAHRHWLHARAKPLRWHTRRTWNTTSGGSAWVGDYVGRRGHRRVEYLAVH